ncbi:unnamed protein product [Taenia asiatica]|uniref:Coiled-coil domain-containing protein 14 n=1 Tax=Taenia asiatica TaxID=60517 RepID=A0A0R3VU86_TAEAS|nr:unnamed protein product [Taenia asiatica]
MRPELKRQTTTRQPLTRKATTRRPALPTSVQKDCARLLNDLLVGEDIIQSVYKNISGIYFLILSNKECLKVNLMWAKSSGPAQIDKGITQILRTCQTLQRSVVIIKPIMPSSKKSTPRMIDEELSKEFPAISDDSESPIDFANLLQRIKSVAKILRDADLEFLANDAEEAASRILKTNLVLPQATKSSRGCQTPAETRSVQSSTNCDVETSDQSTTGGNLSSQLKSLSLTLNRQQVEYEKQRLEMNQKELAFKSNLDAMVSQLRNLVTENASLRHQLASKDAQLTSLGRLVTRVTSKLSRAPSTRTLDAGDLFESSIGSTGSNASQLHHTPLSPPGLTFLQCPSRFNDISLTPRIVPFEGLEDIDNDNITSVSAMESRRCNQTILGLFLMFLLFFLKRLERKDRSPSTSSVSSLRTADMMQFQRGLAALDGQIAKLRDSLHLSG